MLMVARRADSAGLTQVLVLRTLACATVALAPLEGYLLRVHGQLAKLAPALLALAWVVVRVRQRLAPRRHPVHVVLALFAVVLLASSAVHAGGPYTLDYTVRWLPFLALTVILIDLADREVPGRLLVAAAVAGAAVAAGAALVAMLVLGQSRASGPLEDPNDLAYFLVAAIPLLVALPVRRELRALPAVAAVVLVAGAAATFSRGGAIALALATAWLVLRRALPVRVLGYALGALLVLGAAAALLAGPRLEKSLGEKSFIAASNVDTRELRWQAAARMFADNPVLGVGPGGFREHYAAMSHNAEISEQTPVAHDMYLEVGAELGLAGLVLFFALLAVAATSTVATQRVLRARGDPRPAVAVQAAMVAVVVASAFLSQQYYLPLWLLIALAVAGDLRVRRKEGNRHCACSM